MKKEFTILLIFISGVIFGQGLLNGNNNFTLKDTLRGTLSPLRSCFDVGFYDLNLKIKPDNKYIEGFNKIVFKAVTDFQRFQIDLFDNLKISKIDYKGEPLKFERQFNAVFVDFPDTIKKGSIDSISVYYKGNPVSAKHAPWDGGFDWKQDEEGNHWVGVACEGIGASLWWPNKDHLSDEPDSMMIRITVPKNLFNVSNGRLRQIVLLDSLYYRYDWFVSYPINNYNVTVNIGKYIHFNEMYIGINGTPLSLDYYVLPANLEKAKIHFEQVKPMMKCYEEYLGTYPFYRDGYKLVETPYLGMEHQTAIAYGNGYKTGYAGRDFSGIGLDFDYIIIHESGHEWWGNLVSCADVADLWIHEGFCTYSEAIYVECMFDYEKAMDYMEAKQSHVGNKSPLIGIYNVNKEGDGDMYNKGALILNTLRHLIEDDTLWWGIIKGITTDFAYQTVSSKQIEDYISEKSGKDFSDFFDQYLRQPNIPVFEYEIVKQKKVYSVKYRWADVIDNFDMPVPVSSSPNKWEWVFPTKEWKTAPLTDWNKKTSALKVDTRHIYVGVKKVVAK